MPKPSQKRGGDNRQLTNAGDGKAARLARLPSTDWDCWHEASEFSATVWCKSRCKNATPKYSDNLKRAQRMLSSVADYEGGIPHSSQKYVA
jgi:hypothetical protein